MRIAKPAKRRTLGRLDPAKCPRIAPGVAPRGIKICSKAIRRSPMDVKKRVDSMNRCIRPFMRSPLHHFVGVDFPNAVEQCSLSRQRRGTVEQLKPQATDIPTPALRAGNRQGRPCNEA